MPWCGCDVIAGRGDEGIEKVRELTGGDGTHAVNDKKHA